MIVSPLLEVLLFLGIHSLFWNVSCGRTKSIISMDMNGEYKYNNIENVEKNGRDLFLDSKYLIEIIVPLNSIA